LVGVLCFLQPIVRGWARYRSPMARFAPHRPAQLEERAARPAVDSLESVAFWAERRGFERYEFLEALLAALKERGLEARMSTEWSRHDLEIAHGPWTRLWLSSVTEELSEGRKVLRCRLRTAWTLRAVLAFGLVLGAVLLATGLVARQSQWIWMAPLVLPMLYYFFENDTRRLRRSVIATLLEKSEERGLVVMGTRAAEETNVAPAELDLSHGDSVSVKNGG
jgi:hypothetical protein